MRGRTNAKMFTPDQSPSANGAAPNAPTYVEDVATLIRKVLRDAPNNLAAENNLNSNFATKAALDSPGNLSQIYAALPYQNIQQLQGNYYALATVTTDKPDGKLCTFTDQDSH